MVFHKCTLTSVARPGYEQPTEAKAHGAAGRVHMLINMSNTWCVRCKHSAKDFQSFGISSFVFTKIPGRVFDEGIFFWYHTICFVNSETETPFPGILIAYVNENV